MTILSAGDSYYIILTTLYVNRIDRGIVRRNYFRELFYGGKRKGRKTKTKFNAGETKRFNERAAEFL